MQTIALGRRNPKNLVVTWEEFLRGEDLFMEAADGLFTAATKAATVKFQKGNGLTADGIIGNRTWGAAMAEGLHMVEDKASGKESANWPPRPAKRYASGQAARQKLWGAFKYKPAPTKGNPEGIRITDNWSASNISRVTIPQLKGVNGAPKSGRVYFHTKAVAQLKALFEAWELAGLDHLILGWSGSWVPRYIRGSRITLSNHAWGTAFDMNYPWNMLRRTPALVGQKGSVRELVELAWKLGFNWGGWWGYPQPGKRPGRSDGMHFECVRILSEEEIQAVLDSIDVYGD